MKITLKAGLLIAVLPTVCSQTSLRGGSSLPGSRGGSRGGGGITYENGVEAGRIAPVATQGDSQRFLDPHVNGFPVDYCSRYQNTKERRGIDCGQPAADLFCFQQGFRTATFFMATVYQKGASITLGDAKVNPADVGGDGAGRHTYFTNITCSFTSASSDSPIETETPVPGIIDAHVEEEKKQTGSENDGADGSN